MHFKTSRSEYLARSVLLAIGRRGTPRKLEVTGEELPKVVYRLIDPEQYRGRHVLVVGGGDSAIEAAVAVGTEDGTTVTLSYRGEVFGRIKPKNREQLAQAEKDGLVKVLLRSNVVRIEDRHVVLSLGDHPVTLDNDVVIVCAGGILPIPMLKDIGVEVETKYGET